ncbi:MAG: hypothetical protein ABI120_26280 [Gemmatimonadaceae bacterium]
MKRFALMLFSLMVCAAASARTVTAQTQDESSVAIDNCLKAWGKHPFGENPKFRSLPVTVKVFGIGTPNVDTIKTSGPDLVLVKAGVNVMGGTTVDLQNPNGWYCFVTNVNVMGKMKIKAACTAHLAQSHDGVTVLGGDSTNKSVTVMGKTEIELQGCPKKDDSTISHSPNPVHNHVPISFW